MALLPFWKACQPSPAATAPHTLTVMRLSDQAIDDLRAILQREFAREFSRDEAAEIGTRVLTLVRLVLRTTPGRPDPSPPGED